MECFCFLIKKIQNKHKAIPVSESTSYHTNNSTADSLSSHRSTTPYIFKDKSNNLRVFEYKELRNATNDFSRLLKIGEGGFGFVYKGLIKSSKGGHTVVAIKKLNQNGLQGHKQWLAEVQFLGVLEHQNLVKLIGYCGVDDDDKGVQRLLVYEFVPNMSLDDHLFNHTYTCLEWSTRLGIVLGAAQGLAYLHGLEVQVIYRDFKASNVLLDKEFKPKLSDFGLAREGPLAGDTHVSTAVMGTYGYAAPDYIETGHLTDKSDVWSFGVVLYEILTGRKSMDRNRPRNEQKLLDWVKRFPLESLKFCRVMDPRLENQYSVKAAKELAKLANLCLLKNARDRPKMSEVVEAIKKAMQYREMDGHVNLLENCFELESDNENKDDNGISKNSETMKRRMLHLSKLNESANDVGRRRLFMILKTKD